MLLTCIFRVHIPSYIVLTPHLLLFVVILSFPSQNIHLIETADENPSTVTIAFGLYPTTPHTEPPSEPMHLLECSGDSFKLKEHSTGQVPEYAILSHTWGPDTEEVTFRDLTDGTGEEKTGYEKIKFCAAQARRDGLQYFWVDTCCINKSNKAELSNAINSMFCWYQNAARCYVYLADVSVASNEKKRKRKRDVSDIQQSGLAWEPSFRESKWFTRGWTLQELLALASVEFFTDRSQA